MVAAPRLWIHACRIGLASPTWIRFYLGPIQSSVCIVHTVQARLRPLFLFLLNTETLKSRLSLDNLTKWSARAPPGRGYYLHLALAVPRGLSGNLAASLC
jgi:hypothetical protein